MGRSHSVRVDTAGLLLLDNQPPGSLGDAREIYNHNQRSPDPLKNTAGRLKYPLKTRAARAKQHKTLPGLW